MLRRLTVIALLMLGGACAPSTPTSAPVQPTQSSASTATSSAKATQGTAEKEAGGGAPITVRIGFNVNGGQTPIYTADKQGFFRKHGLNVEITNFAQNPQMVAAIQSGSLDLMGSIPSYVWSAREAGFDLVTISQHEASRKSPPESGTLMVAANSDIRTGKDLEGKQMAVLTPSSQNTLNALYLLKKQGVDISKITLVTAPFNTHYDLLRSGQVDAVAVVDPFQTQIEVSGVGRVLMYVYYESVPEQPLAALWGSRQWFEAHPEAVDRLQAAMVEAIDYLNNDPNEARRILREFTQVPEDILNQMKVINNWTYQINRQAWIKEAELLVEMGALKALPNPDEYFHPKAAKFFMN